MVTEVLDNTLFVKGRGNTTYTHNTHKRKRERQGRDGYDPALCAWLNAWLGSIGSGSGKSQKDKKTKIEREWGKLEWDVICLFHPFLRPYIDSLIHALLCLIAYCFVSSFLFFSLPSVPSLLIFFLFAFPSVLLSAYVCECLMSNGRVCACAPAQGPCKNNKINNCIAIFWRTNHKSTHTNK